MNEYEYTVWMEGVTQDQGCPSSFIIFPQWKNSVKTIYVTSSLIKPFVANRVIIPKTLYLFSISPQVNVK